MSSSLRSTEALLEASRSPDGSAETEPEDGTGFEFEPETKHHDPVVRLTAAYEADELSAELLENAETGALKRFVVRAETGEFDVRSNPALEAAVRIARSLIQQRCCE